MIRKQSGRKSKKPSQAELEMLYSQMSAREVGEHYGVAESTVRKWIGEYRKETENAEEN